MSPFLARNLSYEDNGTYGQINLLNGYLTVLFGLGIVAVINLLLSEYKNEENKILSANLWIQATMGGLCSLLIFVFSEPLNLLFANDSLSEYLLLYLPSTFFIILSNGFTYYFVHFNKTRQLSFITIGVNLCRVGAVFYAVNVLNSLYYVIVLLNIVNGVNFFAQAWAIRKWYFPVRIPDFQIIRYMIKLGYPYLGLAVIGYSILNANGVVVSNVLGVQKFAIYRNGALELPFVATLYNSVSAVTLPRVVEYVKSNSFQALLELKRKSSIAVAVMIYPIVYFVIINGEAFMTLYLGEKYVESGIIFSIYNVAVLIRINSYSDILTAQKKTKEILVPNLFILVVNLGLAIILTHFLGVNGAAIAYSFSIFLYSYLLIFSATKSINSKIRDYFDFVGLGKISVISIIFALIAHLFIEPKIISFVVITTLYLLICYLLIIKLDLFERSYMPRSINRLLSAIKI